MHRYAALSEPAAWLARRPGELRVDQGCRVLVAAVVLLFPGLCLLVDRSDSVSLLLLGAVGVLVWARDGFKSNLSRDDWLLVGAFYAFFLSALISFEFGHQTSEGFRLLGRYLRFLFVLPVLIALRRYRPPAPVLWVGLGLGCLLIGMDALWEYVAGFGAIRPAGDTDVAIVFGDLAMLTGFAFAAGYPYLRERILLAGLLVAIYALLALLASFLSGARGAWLAVPVLLLLFLTRRHLLTLSSMFVGVCAVITLFAALLLLPQISLLDRVQSIAAEWNAYWELEPVPNPQPSNPLCLDQRNALRSWVEVNSPYPEGVDIEVTRVSAADATALAAHGCTHGWAIDVLNATKGMVWIAMLRYQLDGDSTARTYLLFKGHGYAAFANQPAAATRIDDSGFAPVALGAASRYGGALSLGVDPGSKLSLLPLESYMGEYRYAMLETPVAARLEMWTAALRLFREAPLVGIGTGAYQSGARGLAAQGKAAPYAANFDHPHNDYLNALSDRGLIGFVALLLLLSVPLRLFWKKLDSRDPRIMSVALGGLVVVVSYAMCAFTETLFIHSITISWYVVLIPTLYISASLTFSSR